MVTITDVTLSPVLARAKGSGLGLALEVYFFLFIDREETQIKCAQVKIEFHLNFRPS